MCGCSHVDGMYATYANFLQAFEAHSAACTTAMHGALADK